MTPKTFPEIIYDSKMTSFIDYITNSVIKFPIYFNSHKRIVGQVMDMILKWFHVSMKERFAYKY